VPVTETQFDALRDRMVAVERQQAVREETMKVIGDRLTKIESTLSRLTWIVITAVVGAAITFLLNGGAIHVPVL
jgi:hypothetical protein